MTARKFIFGGLALGLIVIVFFQTKAPEERPSRSPVSRRAPPESQPIADPTPPSAVPNDSSPPPVSDLVTLARRVQNGDDKAAVLLTRNPSPEAQKEALAILDDPNLSLTTRNYVCYGISLGGAEWKEPLCRKLETARDAETSLFCLSALSNVAPEEVLRRYADPETAQFLRDAMNREEFILKTHAIIAMGATGDFPVLVERCVTDPDVRCRDTYARAIAAAGSEQGIDLLLSRPEDAALLAAAVVAPKERILPLLDARPLSEAVIDVLATLEERGRLEKIAEADSPFREQARRRLTELPSR